MQLPIKHKYFEQIKQGKKNIEFRDAHITFVDEKTGERMRRTVTYVGFIDRLFLPQELRKGDILEDDKVIVFYLGGELLC